MSHFHRPVCHTAGHVVTIPNHVLYASTVFNVARAGPMSDPIELLVRRQTTPQQLKNMEADFAAFIREHPDDYLPSSKLWVRDYRDWNSLLLVFFLDHTTNWQLGQHLHRKQNAIFCVQSLCAKYGVSAQQSQLPVEVTLASDRAASAFSASRIQSSSRDFRTTEVSM